MDDFKWGEEVEVSNGDYDPWKTGYIYGCRAPNTKDHIVFMDGLTNTARSTSIYRRVRRPRPDLRVDDRVWVRDAKGMWLKRHFAGWDEETGRIKAFGNGTTSWSVEDTHNWKFTYEEYYLADPEQEDK